jgi:acyl carrier protein
VDPATGQRLYRTGDCGRVLANGEIAFLGRMDDLIKIRGFRIEPEELVAHLISHPEIRTSVVVARGDGTYEKHLVAYLVLADGAALTATEVREYLRARVPDFMIPASFVCLPSLPLTSTGKCDRRSLPDSAAGNLLPESLFQVPVSPASRDDDFFLVGGHSMLAAQLVARVRESLGVSLSLRQLFKAPTIASLADAVDRKLATK